MKLLPLLASGLFPILLFAQNTAYIDSLRNATDEIKFKNAVSIDDTVFALKATKERKITAFMFGDTVKKVIVRFKGSPRIREVYMGPLEDYQSKVIYVKDIDSTDGKLLFEAYGWDGDLLKSNVAVALDSEELANPRIALNNADYETRIRFHIADSKADKYIFKCKLTEQVHFP